MKKLFMLFVCALALGACKQNEEPIDIVAQERSYDTATLIKYKQDKGERPIVVGMHYDWGSKPGYSLQNIPDSLDLVVLKNNYALTNSSQLAELRYVQQSKGTKVIPSIDLEYVHQEAQKAITARYKVAKKEQDARWLKEGNKPQEAEAIATVYQKLKDDIRQDELGKATKWLEMQIKDIDVYLGTIGYDGISLRLPQGEDTFSSEQVEGILKRSTQLAGKDKGKILLIEQPSAQHASYVAMANYLVLSSSGIKDFNDYKAMLDAYAMSKVLLAYDLADADLKKGFKNTPIFSASETLDKGYMLLNYMHPAKAGVAIYHSERYYFETELYQGFVNPYVPLKAIINQIAQNKK